MQVITKTVNRRGRSGDDMQALVSAIAGQMVRLYGASGALRWDGIERHLARLVSDARRDALAMRAVVGKRAARR